MKKVYCISVDDFCEYVLEANLPDNSDIDNISNEDYKDACEECGWVLTLDEFVYQFNNDLNLAPTTDCHYIRII